MCDVTDICLKLFQLLYCQTLISTSYRPANHVISACVLSHVKLHCVLNKNNLLYSVCCPLIVIVKVNERIVRSILRKYLSSWL